MLRFSGCWKAEATDDVARDGSAADGWGTRASEGRAGGGGGRYTDEVVKSFIHEINNWVSTYTTSQIIGYHSDIRHKGPLQDEVVYNARHKQQRKSIKRMMGNKS